MKADDINAEQVLRMIEEGQSYVEIAKELGCSRPTLYKVMNAHDEEQARKGGVDTSARARQSSAEAWLDRGLRELERSLDRSSGIDPSAARAYEQACARRAAIRNPAYRDSSKVEAAVTAQIAGSLTLNLVGPKVSSDDTEQAAKSQESREST